MNMCTFEFTQRSLHKFSSMFFGRAPGYRWHVRKERTPTQEIYCNGFAKLSPTVTVMRPFLFARLAARLKDEKHEA